MIITAQPFYDEVELLRLKCRELAGLVDLHVVVESTRTFTGLMKPLYFAENKNRFQAFPIHHVIVDLPAEAASPWAREDIQRQAVFDAVRTIKPDLVAWVDTDEIPRRDAFDRFREMNVKVAALEMDHIIFFFDRVDATQPPANLRHAKISRFDPSDRNQPARYSEGFPVVPKAGWHFDYFGGSDRVTRKTLAFSHGPEPGCVSFRAALARGELPGIERTTHYPIELLPRVIQENPRDFAGDFSALAGRLT